MDVLVAGALRLSEEPLVDDPSVPAWAFGVFAFAVLVVLLVVTMMVKVDD